MASGLQVKSRTAIALGTTWSSIRIQTQTAWALANVVLLKCRVENLSAVHTASYSTTCDSYLWIHGLYTAVLACWKITNLQKAHRLGQ